MKEQGLFKLVADRARGGKAPENDALVQLKVHLDCWTAASIDAVRRELGLATTASFFRLALGFAERVGKVCLEYGANARVAIRSRKAGAFIDRQVFSYEVNAGAKKAYAIRISKTFWQKAFGVFEQLGASTYAEALLYTFGFGLNVALWVVAPDEYQLVVIDANDDVVHEFEIEEGWRLGLDRSGPSNEERFLRAAKLLQGQPSSVREGGE